MTTNNCHICRLTVYHKGNT